MIKQATVQTLTQNLEKTHKKTQITSCKSLSKVMTDFQK